MFVRPTVRLNFRRRNRCMLSKFVSAKPLVLLKLLFRSQHIMSGHDRPAREIPWGGMGPPMVLDLFIFLSCKYKTNILKNLTKENLHLKPPPPAPPPPPTPHTHTFTTRLGHFSDPVRDHFSASSYQNRSPMSMLETPRIRLHVFYSFNFQDYSLYFRSCFNLSSCIKSHCHSFTFSLFLSPCQNAREGVGNIKR